MRILLVSEMIPWLPSHDGFRVSPANLIRNLSQRHEVHLIALAYGGESKEQSEWSRAVLPIVLDISFRRRNSRTNARDNQRAGCFAGPLRRRRGGKNSPGRTASRRRRIGAAAGLGYARSAGSSQRPRLEGVALQGIRQLHRFAAKAASSDGALDCSLVATSADGLDVRTAS